MTKLEFGQTIKQKYPQYQNVSDAELADMVLSKYPQYQVEIQDSSTPEGQLPNNPVDFIAGTVKNIPKSAWENTKQIGGAIANVFNPDPEQNTLRNLAELTYEIDPFTGGLNQRLHGMNPERDKLNSLKNYFGSRYGVTDEQGRFDPSLERLGQTVYNDPVGVAMDVAPIAGAGSKVLQGTKAGKALNVVSKLDPVEAVSSGAGRVFGKAGRGIEGAGRDYGIRSTRINDRNIAKWEKASKGMGVPEKFEDFLARTDLYGQDLDAVDNYISPRQELFDDSTIRSGKNVPAQEIVDRFNKEIDGLYKKAGLGDAVAERIVKDLISRRDKFVQRIGGQVSQGEGFRAYSPLNKEVPLEDVTKTRRSIDANTPNAQFDKVGSSSQRAAGNVYRSVQNKFAGTSKQGKELSKLYKFRDYLDKAPKGKGNLPLSLNKGAWGAALNKVPVVGPLAGVAIETVANNPAVIGSVSKTMQKTGQVLQGVGNSKIGSVFKKATKAVSPFRGQLDKERGKVKAKSPNLRGYSR